jgi:hypothetical protein
MKIMKLYWMKIDQVQVRNNKCLERNSTVLNQINHQLKLSLFNRIWKIKNDITIIYKQNHKLGLDRSGNIIPFNNISQPLINRFYLVLFIMEQIYIINNLFIRLFFEYTIKLLIENTYTTTTTFWR